MLSYRRDIILSIYPYYLKSEKSSITEAQKRYKNRSVYFIVGIIFKRVSHKTKRLANYCPNGDRECITFNYCQTKHLQHGIFCWNEARIYTCPSPNWRECSFKFTRKYKYHYCLFDVVSKSRRMIKNNFPKWSWIVFTYLSKWELIQGLSLLIKYLLKAAKCFLLFIICFIFSKQVNSCISDQSSKQ